MNQFIKDLEEAKMVANEAAAEFLVMRRAHRIHERLVRRKVARFISTLEQFSHVPSLAESSGRDTTKDGGTWFLNSNTEGK